MDVTYGLSTPPDLFPIDDLLDFSNDHDLLLSSSTTDSAILHLPPPPSPTTANPSSDGNYPSATTNNSNPNRTSNFPDDLCLPNEDVAELEWLSKFVDESFSDFSMNDDLSASAASASAGNASSFRPQPSSPSVLLHGKARSKRSRVAGSSNHKSWNSNSSSSPESDTPSIGGKSKQGIRKTMKEISCGSSQDYQYGGGRKCTHCASEKTPQWRTGPMGPKTLCNACGVRYKSGRLVPEYRPAASPTFVLTQHSNSHRKVMELRRQKEEELMNITTVAHGPARQDHQHPNDPHDFFHHHHFQVC